MTLQEDREAQIEGKIDLLADWLMEIIECEASWTQREEVTKRLIALVEECINLNEEELK